MSLSIDKEIGLWSRVAGDGLDIATLVAHAGPENPKRARVGFALAVVAAITLLDVTTARTTTEAHRRNKGLARDYSDRSGLPKGIVSSRGMAAPSG